MAEVKHTGDKKAGTTMVLGEDWLAGSDAAGLAQLVLGQKTLTVRDVTRQTRKGTTEITGVAALLGLADVPVRILASGNGEPEFTLTASLPRGWKIADSFRHLPETPTLGSAAPPAGSSVMHLLSFSDVKLVLATHPYHDDELDANLGRGLNVVAQLELPSVLKQLELFTTAGKQLRVSGSLDDGSDDPLIDISVPVSFNGDMGPLKLQDTALRFYSTACKWQYAPRSGIEFRGTVDIGQTQCRLRSDVRFDDGNPLFTLWGRFSGASLAGLEDLARFLGAKDLFGTLPPDLHKAMGSIELRQLKAGFSTRPLSLNHVGFSVAANARWRPLGRKLEVEGLKLDGLIAHPAQSQRRTVNLGLRGQVRIDHAILEIGADLSGAKLHGALREGDQLPAGTLLKRLMPRLVDIPSLDIRHLVFEADTSGGNYAVEAAVDGAWPVPIPGLKMAVEDPVISINRTSEGAGGTAVSLSGVLGLQSARIALTAELGKTFSFEGRSEAIKLTDITRTFIKNFPTSFPDLAVQDVAVSLSADSVIEFKGRCDDVPLHEIAGKIGIPLPDGLGTDIKLETLYLRTSLPGGKDTVFKLRTEFPKGLPFPESAKNHIDLHAVELSWSHGAGIGGRLDLGGTLSPAAGVHVKVPRFVLGYDAARGWLGTAKATASIYGTRFTDFAAGVDDGRFSLSCSLKRSAGKLLAVHDVVDCQVAQFSVFVDQAMGDAPGSKWQFSVDGTGRIKIGPRSKPYLNTDFDIQVGNGELQLQARDPAPVSVPLSKKAPKPNLELQFSDISVQWNRRTSECCVVGAGTGSLQNLPEMVRGRFFPEHLPDVELMASKKGLSVTCDLSESPLSPEVRIFHIGGEPVGPQIDINRLSIELGDNPTISSELQLSKLDLLNYLFGKKDNGQPRIRFLKDTSTVTLSLGKDPILGLQLESSPFVKFDFQKDADGKRFFIADFGGGLNRFKVHVPELGYSEKGGWSGAAGMEVLDPPIRIPLTPLKFVLRRLGVPPKVNNAIPQSVPIDVVDINKHRTFRSVLEAALNSKTKVEKLYRSKAAGPILKEFDEVVWQKIRKGLDQMPDRFRHYASPPDIRKLNVTVAAAPGGGWSGGLAVGGREPLSFMLPFVGGPVPELIGFRLRSFELGQAAAGVATFKIDGAIDRFDLVTLVVAMLNSQTRLLSQEQVRNLTNHLTLDNVFGVAFSGFPVPIPILYDTIAWDYKNWWGLEGRSDWTFKLGKDTDIWTTLGAMMPFFSQREYHLADPANRNRDRLRLILRVGPNYLKLPAYLGGSRIGPAKGTPALPADVSARWWLDACKFINPGYAIRSVPLRNPGNGAPIRIGSKTITFGPLAIKAGWCLTTEAEFKEEIIGDKQAEEILRAIDMTKTLQHLPQGKAGVAYDKGFIVVLAGSAKLAGILEYTAQFGIAVTSTAGFESRIYMAGGITGVVTLSIDGGIQVTRQGATKIDGTCDLRVAGRSMIKIHGLIEVTGHSFCVGCKVKLARALDFGGRLFIGKDGVYIEGSFTWHYAAGKKLSEAGIRAAFDGSGMSITLRGKKIFGSNCEVRIYVNQKGVPGALISFDLTGLNDLFLQEIARNLTEVRKIVEQEQRGFEQLVKNNVRKVQNFDQLRTGLPSFLDGIRTKVVSIVNSRVNSAWNGLSGFRKTAARAVGYSKSKIRREAVRQARAFMKPLDTLGKQLVAIERRKIKDDEERVRQTRSAISKALNDAIKLNGKKVPIQVWKVAVKNITVRFDTRQLVDLRNLVNELPNDWSKAEAEHERIADSFASRAAQALTEITNSVTKGLKNKVPELKAIELNAPLSGLKGAVVKPVVTVKQGRVITDFEAEVDLENFAKSIPGITKHFIKMIS